MPREVKHTDKEQTDAFKKIVMTQWLSRGECATEEERTLIGLKFSILRRVNIRRLKPGQSLHEHGIIFERLADGSYRARVMVYGNLSV